MIIGGDLVVSFFEKQYDRNLGSLIYLDCKDTFRNSVESLLSTSTKSIEISRLFLFFYKFKQNKYNTFKFIFSNYVITVKLIIYYF